MCTKNRGPNSTISLIPAFGRHPLQIYGPSITEARVNLPNVLAKFVMVILVGGPQAWGPPSLDTRIPPVTPLNRIETLCILQNKIQSSHLNWIRLTPIAI